MSKETAILALGLWVVVLTQLGIPSSSKSVLFALSGLAIAGIGLYMRMQANRRHHRQQPPHVEYQTFVENEDKRDLYDRDRV